MLLALAVRSVSVPMNEPGCHRSASLRRRSHQCLPTPGRIAVLTNGTGLLADCRSVRLSTVVLNRTAAVHLETAGVMLSRRSERVAIGIQQSAWKQRKPRVGARGPDVSARGYRMTNFERRSVTGPSLSGGVQQQPQHDRRGAESAQKERFEPHIQEDRHGEADEEPGPRGQVDRRHTVCTGGTNWAAESASSGRSTWVGSPPPSTGRYMRSPNDGVIPRIRRSCSPG